MKAQLQALGKSETEIRSELDQMNNLDEYQISFEKTDVLTSKITDGEYTMISHTIPEFTKEEFEEANDLWSDYSYASTSTEVNKAENSIYLGKGSEINLNNKFYLKVNNNWVEYYGKNNCNYSNEEIEQVHDIASALNHFIRYANGQISQNLFTENMNKTIEKLLQKGGIDASKVFTVNGTEFCMKDGYIAKKDESQYSYTGMPEHIVEKAIKRYEQSLNEYI